MAGVLAVFAGVLTGTAPRHATPAGARPARASFLVTLTGTVRAVSRSTQAAGMVDTTTSLDYRWSERLAETFSASGQPISQSDAVRGEGETRIVVVDHRTYGENHSLSCGMKLHPEAGAIRTAERLGLSLDSRTGTAHAGGPMPLDLVSAVYTGPPQLGGLVPPCSSARPYDWMRQLAIPLRENPRAAPFRLLGCDLGPVGSSCSAPFSIHMSWPDAAGSSSLALSAELVARHLARAPAASRGG